MTVKAAGPSTIAGTVANQPTTAEAAIDPFSGVAITDPNTGATDTLTITVSGAGGILADGQGFSGLMTQGGGIFTLAGTAAAVTSELEALVYTSIAGRPGAPGRPEASDRSGSSRDWQ